MNEHMKILIKKITAVLIALTLLLPAGTMAGVTDDQTPAKVNNGVLKWETRLGTGYTNSPTPPIAKDGYAYVHAGKYIYKMNKDTGTVAATTNLDMTPGYAMSPLVTDGTYLYAFCSYSSGGQAMSAVVKVKMEDMSLKWTSNNSYGGQNASPLVYDNGYIYGGTWGDGSDSGTYFCIDGSNGSEKWSFAESGNEGFYWAGACVSGDYVIFGSDGSRQADRRYSSKLYSVKKDSTVENIKENVKALSVTGSIRSTVKKDGKGYLYFTTNDGGLYKVKTDDKGNLPDEGSSDIKRVKLASDSVNTPVIYGSALYVGDNSGNIYGYDISDDALTESFRTTVPGAVKGEMLYSTGSSCLYTAYNTSDSGIYYIKLKAGGKAVESKGNLFKPSHKAYCISPLISDGGNIYYKNDSGYIMCVSTGYDTSAPVLTSAVSKGYNSVRLTWKPKDNISSFIIERTTDGRKFTVSASSTSWTDKGLKTGKTYRYRIRALCGEGTYTGYSAVKKVKPVPAATKVYTAAGKKRITVKWKKVSGATGYYVYRATKKKGKYKKVKSTKARKWTNKKLKKGRRYYYKVKAYRKVSGKKIFGSYSNISYKKAK